MPINHRNINIFKALHLLVIKAEALVAINPPPLTTPPPPPPPLWINPLPLLVAATTV